MGDDIYLPLIRAGSLSGVGSVMLAEADDGTSDTISIQPFPFGDSVQDTVFVRQPCNTFLLGERSNIFFQVGTNGILSFDVAYNSWSNVPFSENFPEYVVAPFWDDVNIVGGNGQITYEIHEDGYFLDQVNSFLQKRRPSSFVGTWMLVAYWDAVAPFLFFGDSESGVRSYFASNDTILCVILSHASRKTLLKQS